MKRSAKVVLLGIFLLTFMAGSVLAGTTRVNQGGANNVAVLALETMNTPRNFQIQSTFGPRINTPGQGAVEYVYTQNLTSGNLVRVTLSGAAFTGQPVYVGGFNSGAAGAANNTAHRLSTATPTAGATTQNFQLEIPVNVLISAGGNNALFLTNDATLTVAATDLSVAGLIASNMAFQFPVTASASTPSITIDIVTSGGQPLDATSSATIAQVTPERTVSLFTNNLLIDYVNTPFNGNMFTTGSSGMAARNVATNAAVAFNINNIANNYSVGRAGQNAGLSSNAVVNFDSTNNWQGVSRMWIGGASCGVAANVSNTATSPVGAVALNITAAAFNQAAVATVTPFICIEVAGNTELQSRNITGNVLVNTVGGQNMPTTTTVFQTWLPNGFQAFVPHMRYSDTTRGFIRLVNNGARDAVLTGIIRLANGTVIPSIAMGSILAGQTINVSAQTLGEDQGLGTAADYALQVTGTVAPDSIYADAFFNLLSSGVWTTRQNTLYETAKVGMPSK